MEINEFLTADRVILDLRVRDKATLLHDVAQRLAASTLDIPASEIETALLAGEQLGSTGLGNGFALPHARLDRLRRVAGLLVRTARPVQFEAIDDKPVQLVFALLIPAGESNAHLAAISRRFRNANTMANLLNAETAASAFHSLTTPADCS